MVTIEVIQNAPSQDHWTDMMRSYAPKDALRLWQLAIECLDATDCKDQDGWGRRIGIAERILEERGIPRY